MARYIDADEAKKVISGIDSYFAKFIDDIPTADVVERKKGKWIPANNVGDCCYMCSICGYVYDAYSLRADNFCQSCGADMRGEDNDT